MIALLVITDGRKDCIRQTIPSALAMLAGPLTRFVIYDDSGDDEHADWLRMSFPTFELVTHPDGRQGFGGAIRAAWSRLASGSERFVFHLEDDFTFNRPVDLEAMAAVLDADAALVQLALRRQPWNPDEIEAGGVIEQRPHDYSDRCDQAGNSWLEHRLFFTTNPSLYRSDLCELDWPNAARSEGIFTHDLLVDPHVRFGYWGERASKPWVTHIGRDRVGHGY